MEKRTRKRILSGLLALFFSLELIACTSGGGTGDSSTQPQQTEVTSLQLNTTEINAFEGETYTLIATVLPENATNTELTWRSSNEAVATVSEGVVSCLKSGTAQITVTTSNDIVATCNVIVSVEPAPTFAKMYIDTQGKPIDSKEVYVGCSVSVTNTDAEYCFENLTGKIKGRGNSTWEMDKKPYKLKFDRKIDLFGNGSAKTWTLIANHCDQSLIRNHLVYTLAEQFSTLENTTKIFTVDLYLNGEYNGVYLVCEQNETGTNRVDIDESLDYVDTGYLIELDARAPSEGVEGEDYFVLGTESYAIKGPDTEDENFTSEHFDFIQAYMTDAYAALLSGNFETVREYLDVDTFVDAYVIHELIGMVDVGFSSFYLHKDAGGKLKAGPLWDMDVSAGNCDYHPDAIRTDYLWARTNQWYKMLLRYTQFKDLVRNRLQSFDYQGFIDQEISEILKYEEAYNANFTVWNILGKTVWPNPPEIATISTWRGHVEYLQSWITRKLSYMYEVFSASL